MHTAITTYYLWDARWGKKSRLRGSVMSLHYRYRVYNRYYISWYLNWKLLVSDQKINKNRISFSPAAIWPKVQTINSVFPTDEKLPLHKYSLTNIPRDVKAIKSGFYLTFNNFIFVDQVVWWSNSVSSWYVVCVLNNAFNKNQLFWV